VYKSTKQAKSKKSPWFNDACKSYKNSFLHAKRIFKNNPQENNRIYFLQQRSEYAKQKRSAKYNYYNKEKHKLSNMCQQNSKKFWKYITKFTKNKSEGISDVSLQDFVDHFKNISNSIDISSLNTENVHDLM